MRSACCFFVAAVIIAIVATAQTSAPAKPPHKSLYLSDNPLNFAAIVPPPPADHSAAAINDLVAVKTAQKTRTKSSIEAAQKDDQEEDIFVYATVLGSRFNAKDLPVTAAFSLHVRNEAGTVTPALKTLWNRPRPFVADKSVHPVCEQKVEPSYPSGHSMVGYLEGFALAQMIPQRSGELLARAREYASHRVACGVHYPSDTEASYTAALTEFGALMSSARFRAELAEASKETRAALGLPALN
jgi:acid phosphatase (class A)